MIHRRAQEVIERRHAPALVVNDERDVFQVRVRVAHHRVEDDPAEHLQARRCLVAALLDEVFELGKRLAAVLVVRGFVEHLSAVQHMQSQGLLGARCAVKPLNDERRLGQVQVPDLGHIEPQPRRQHHREGLVDHRVGVALCSGVRLEDVRRRGALQGLAQLLALRVIDHHHLVLSPCQRHAFGGSFVQGCPGQIADAMRQVVPGQRQHALFWRLCPLWLQHQSPG